MAYPYYPNYQNYGNMNQQTPIAPIQQSQQQFQQSNNNSMIWVQGEAGAKAYLVAPNSTVQLWDSESATIYLKSADASGMPTIRILDYTERNAPQKPSESEKMTQREDFATKKDISALKNEINELRSQIKPKKTIKKGDGNE